MSGIYGAAGYQSMSMPSRSYSFTKLTKFWASVNRFFCCLDGLAKDPEFVYLCRVGPTAKGHYPLDALELYELLKLLLDIAAHVDPQLASEFAKGKVHVGEAARIDILGIHVQERSALVPRFEIANADKLSVRLLVIRDAGLAVKNAPGYARHLKRHFAELGS